MCQCDGLGAILRSVHDKPNALQLNSCDLEVNRFIVGDQNVLAVIALPDQRLRIRFRLRHGLDCRRALFELRGKPEGAANSRRALDAGVAAHQFGQTAVDRQAKAGATVFSGHGIVSLLKGAKEPGHSLCRDTDTGISHLEAHRSRFDCLFLLADAQCHGSLFGELDGVVCVIKQCLLQTGGIAIEVGRDWLVLDQQLDSLGPAAFGQEGNDVLQQAVNGDRRFLKHQLAGLDLRDVEDVIDDV